MNVISMSLPDRYFDHAATTPVDPRVLAEMLPWFSDSFGNTESPHSFGKMALAAVDRARERVARAIGAEDPSQIVFNSGSTEGCNWIIRNFDNGWFGPFEHAAVREPALQQGHRPIPNSGTDLLPIEVGNGCLVSKMWVNNETGTVWNPTENPWVNGKRFTDATQALGKVEMNVTNVDFATFSGHKIFGPKGVGAVYLESPNLGPCQRGGEHEFGLRAGTLNVPAIVGFGVACSLATEERQERSSHAADLRSIVLEELRTTSEFTVNGGAAVVPHILSLSFSGVEGESVVLALDAEGFSCSAGAACSSGSTDPSPVLLAMGVPVELARGTVRISFGPGNSPDSARDLGKALSRSVRHLRSMGVVQG